MTRKEVRRAALNLAAGWLMSDAEGADVEGYSIDDEEKIRDEVLVISRRLRERLQKLTEKDAGPEKCPHGNALIPGEDCACGCRP